ncbi:SGF29 tudor-like domain-containing protein [Trametes meyenii]|nr:SGF29 tudor-like domain-containing protein [Trametes meyenii]
MLSEQDRDDTVGRVHRLLSQWPTDDTLPSEGIDGVKSLYKKLNAGLNEVKATAQKDAEAIDDVLERLTVLIALRKASEALPPPEKRNKRPRGPSPSVPAAPPPTVAPAPSRSMSITVPPRGSVGPQPSIPFSREPKARREALAKQLPLQEGRKVAFHPPTNTSKADGAASGKDEEWILAVVTKCINQDKNRYEVQDPEPQEDGQPGQRYNTTLRAIIPLPDPNAPPESAAHLHAYPEFATGATVMALYPDTSCFYRAEVIASPRDLNPSGRGNGTTKQGTVPMYKLKFEDDDDQEHMVSAHWVVEWPGRD